jgi:predicted phage terminase large subunit-like protein
MWGNEFKFQSDQNQKTAYSNDQQGERLSFSVGGSLTGSGGDIIIIDDPINSKDSNSLVIRESVNRWYDEALSTRLNDPRTGKILLIMQRLHQNDLTGHLLSSGVWDHLILPMRYEPCKNDYDKRKKEGAILTMRHDEDSLRALEKTLGSYGTASQLQQRPAPREGGIIKERWLKFYRELPTVKKWSWSWDTAIKEGENNDFSVGTLWAECDNGYYLVDMFRRKVEYPELRQNVKLRYEGQKSSEVLIEDKSSGQQALQDFKRIGTMPIIAMVPGRDMGRSKTERVEFVSPTFEAGKVFLPERKPWVQDVIDELINFPNATHDDIVDTITQYLSRRLANKKLEYYM